MVGFSKPYVYIYIYIHIHVLISFTCLYLCVGIICPSRWGGLYYMYSNNYHNVYTYAKCTATTIATTIITYENNVYIICIATTIATYKNSPSRWVGLH